jgi:hypothetical protein
MTTELLMLAITPVVVTSSPLVTLSMRVLSICAVIAPVVVDSRMPAVHSR